MKKHHWHAFWHEKLFEKHPQPHCQTRSSPSCRLWATPLPAKHPKCNKQVCFNFFLRSAPLPSPCSDLLHLCKFFVSSSSVSGGRWHDQGLPVGGRCWVVAAAGGCSAAEEGKTCWLTREPWVWGDGERLCPFSGRGRWGCSVVLLVVGWRRDSWVCRLCWWLREGLWFLCQGKGGGFNREQGTPVWLLVLGAKNPNGRVAVPLVVSWGRNGCGSENPQSSRSGQGTLVLYFSKETLQSRLPKVDLGFFSFQRRRGGSNR